MTGPGSVGLPLSQALQRAFVEAGEPSIAAVAAGAGVSRQRLSDWRSGRHVPSRFDDLEPVIAYLRIITVADACAAPAAGDRVTGWGDEDWRQAWRRSSSAEHLTQNGVDVKAEAAGEIDRRPLARAVIALLVILVAALAVMAFLLSWSYR